MSAKYLIDANLPYFFSLWNSPDFIHVRDIDDSWDDDKIWNYAKEQGLTIITKDADFSLKVLLRGAPPKVVHIRFGNLKMRDFHDKISGLWGKIEAGIMQSNLINVYFDRVEMIK
ncbi:MAG TPA: hypothetical protein ENN08_00595 [Bacteroidales bacterium]|nr:hypothetical protein [Bacteroidales bacterium]